MVSIISYSLLVFGDFVSDKKVQYQIGWVVCVLIGIQVVFNIVLIIFGLVKTLINIIKLKNVKKQREKERLANEKERLERREALQLLESLNPPRAQLIIAKPKNQFGNNFTKQNSCLLSGLQLKQRRD
jgi:hypothetical protein